MGTVSAMIHEVEYLLQALAVLIFYGALSLNSIPQRIVHACAPKLFGAERTNMTTWQNYDSGSNFLPCCLLWSCHELTLVFNVFSFPLISGVMFLVPLQICLSFNCDIGGRAVGSRVVPSFPWAWLRPETRGVMSCWAASPREMPRWEPEPSAPGAARPPPALARRENGRKNSVPLPGRSWCSWILGGLTQGIEQCILFKLLTLFSSFLFCHTIVFFWGGVMYYCIFCKLY